MNKKNRYPLGKKIKYILDDFISKGFLAQTLLLVATSITLTLIFGIFAMKFGEESYVEGYWTALMHMLDQGTITADEVGTDSYFVFMLIVTLIGMAITSTIIAIISSAIQGKLNELKKGHSGIIERDHVVVLGFDENTCTICGEIAEGSLMDRERICLVVADDIPKEEMEHAAREYYSGQNSYKEKRVRLLKRKIKLLFRSGDPASDNTMSICAVSDARAVVINREKDTDTIRILLALAAYLKKNGAYFEDDKMPYIVAVIHNTENLSAARAAAGIGADSAEGEKTNNQNKIQIVHDERLLERLFAQTCVQQGLATVMDGLFNYEGASIRIEAENEQTENEDRNPFIGKTLTEISEIVTDAIPLGFVEKNTENRLKACLIPSNDIRYETGNRLVYLSGKSRISTGTKAQISSIGSMKKQHTEALKRTRSFLYIGWSAALPEMINEVNEYCRECSAVRLISSETENLKKISGNLFGFEAIHCDDPYRWTYVKKILDENISWFDPDNSHRLTNIVILSQDDADRAEADEKVMIMLLNIRQYLADNMHTDIYITSEMHLPQNQMLLQKDTGNDFVMTKEITNRVIAQITDDPRKHCIIKELIEHNSAVIELKPLSEYLDISQPFNFACAFSSLKAMDCKSGVKSIPLGWIGTGRNADCTDSNENDSFRLVLNPSAEQLKECHEGSAFDSYRLVVLSAGLH